MDFKKTRNVIPSIPLSNNGVKKSIDEILEYVDKKLIRMMCKNLFSLQFDKFTLPGNKYLLLTCLRMLVGDTTYEQLATF